jgi:hypothetical protein
MKNSITIMVSSDFQTSCLGNLNETNFDFDSVPTPSYPVDVFVSPLDSGRKAAKR